MKPPDRATSPGGNETQRSSAEFLAAFSFLRALFSSPSSSSSSSSSSPVPLPPPSPPPPLTSDALPVVAAVALPFPQRLRKQLLGFQNPSISGFCETPVERVKAKMKFQLSQTAERDSMTGSGSEWERFDFNKDAPLDDEEMEVVDDDVAVVKRIGQSFRFSKIEARREEEIRDAHEAAMFGAPALPPSVSSESKQDGDNEMRETDAKDTATDLISDKVLAKQQGSWRDRIRKGAP